MDESERKNLTYEGRQGKFRYDPKPTMTGYQAGLLIKFCLWMSVFGCTNGTSVESVFDEVYPETQEHWEKLP